MNFHPIFVHFPIALLTVYSLSELIRFRKLAAQPWWFPFKAVLVALGSLGALAARQTGEMAGVSFGRTGTYARIYEAHQLFANATILVFGIIAAVYLVTWVLRSVWGARIAARAEWGTAVRFVDGIARFIMQPPIIVVGALLGLFLVTLTGGLGGILAYGPNVDPVTKLLYSFFH